MKPYRKDTEPPEGSTRPMDPASAIQVLCHACDCQLLTVRRSEDRDNSENP